MKKELLHNIRRLLSFNTIKKLFPLGGWGAFLLLFACNPEDDNSSSMRLPITFSCLDGAVITRASEDGLDEYITDFTVFGVNGDVSGTTFTRKNTVFPNYQVWHTEGLANATSTNTSNWEYVGTVEGAEEQTIKYWDEKHNGHYFWAIGDFYKNGEYEISGSGLPASITVENITQSQMSDDRQCLYYTKPKFVDSDDYGKPVKLTFERYSSRIRVGFYEDVEQTSGDKLYKVTNVKFYQVSTDGTTFNTNQAPTTTVWLKGDFVNECNVRLDYTYAYNGGTKDGVTATTIPAENGCTNMMSFGELNIAGTESGILPYSSSQALFTTNDGSQYIKVIPYNNTKGLTLMCDIEVRLGISQYVQHNVMASIPAHYTNWQPNQAYTYIFKIVTKPDGIAMILANVEVENWQGDGMMEEEWHNW